jgi:hypothetical protein
MKGLKIYHPYGSVGELPWQLREGFEFGGEADEFRLAKCSSGIRTFNEEVEDRAKIAEIQGAIRGADRVIFLGFHFHSQNMDILTPATRHSGAANKQAYATAINRSGSDVTRITGQIVQLGGFGTVHVDKSWDCDGLFREFGTTFIA